MPTSADTTLAATPPANKPKQPPVLAGEPQLVAQTPPMQADSLPNGARSLPVDTDRPPQDCPPASAEMGMKPRPSGGMVAAANLPAPTSWTHSHVAAMPATMAAPQTPSAAAVRRIGNRLVFPGTQVAGGGASLPPQPNPPSPAVARQRNPAATVPIRGTHTQKAVGRSEAAHHHHVLAHHPNPKQNAAIQTQATTQNHRSPRFEPTRDRRHAPLVKLSTQLVQTYVEINKLYYTSQKKRRAQYGYPSEMPMASPSKRSRVFNNGYDDASHDYIIHVGEVWDERYRVSKLLGKGSFGQVVEAFDCRTKEHVAIKIIKNRKAFHHQALIEIRILEFLNGHDPTDNRNIVRMKRYFEFRNHLCLVYELLSFNLYELLRNDNFQGVSLNLVRKFATQILFTLQFLARSNVQVIHCDLKPENVLLRTPRGSRLKVIDFGSSCFASEKAYTYIQSRFYRSPEVLLGHPYSVAIDMWSLGCMLVEMHTGQPLFNGATEHDQMCKIHELLGVPPTEMLQRSSQDKVNRFFMMTAEGAYLLNPSKHYRPHGRTLEAIVTGTVHVETAAEYRSFLDLLRKLLVYDPAQRITPSQALGHPFCKSSTACNTPTAALRRSARLSRTPVGGTLAQKEEDRDPCTPTPAPALDASTSAMPPPFSSPDFSRLRL